MRSLYVWMAAKRRKYGTNMKAALCFVTVRVSDVMLSNK